MSDFEDLRESGYKGEPAPVDNEKIVSGLTKEEAERTLAWAEGVWQRQAEQMAALAEQKARLTPLPGGKTS